MLCILRFGRGRVIFEGAMRTTVFALSVFFSATVYSQDAASLDPIAPETPPMELTVPIDAPAADLAAAESLSAIAASRTTKGNAIDGYTINYNTISILEYLRFASKICNTNFIFNDTELNFTVSVVSDAPITPENVMSTLVQVLRMHGMELLEQDNNLVIHTASDVRQIATLVTESGQGGKAAIVTRIFRIKNTKVDSIAAIIRPMISNAALLETSLETRQLILTDVRTNVDKVASLIDILDSPSTSLGITIYETIHNSPEFLIGLAHQILAPLINGNPFVLVPQALANNVFIVSTPELTEKTIALLQTLDTPPKQAVLTERKLKSENVFIYRPLHTSGERLLKALEDVAQNLEKSGMTQGDLVPTIDTARWISESNSLLFVGTTESIAKIKELLASLDVAAKTPGEASSFFIFRPQNRSTKEILSAIQEMASNLASSKVADKELLHTLQSAKLNEGAGSITFSGEEKTFPQVREMLSNLDIKGRAKSSFFVYKPEHATTEELELSLKSFSKTLNNSSAADQGLITMIQNMQVMHETNSILFTGSEATLQRLKELLPTFDISGKKQSKFFIYKPERANPTEMETALKHFAKTLDKTQEPDQVLIDAINQVELVPETQSLLFTGSETTIKRLKELVPTFDVAHAKGNQFFIYKPIHVKGDQLITSVKELTDNLKASPFSDPALIRSLETMKYVKSTNSFLFTGDTASIKKVEELLATVDVPTKKTDKSFILYHPKHASKERTEAYLKQVADNLSKKGGNEELATAIRSAKWVDASQSFMFSGSESSLSQINHLLTEFDVDQPTAPAKPTYFIYKVQHTTGDLIEEDLDALAKNFASSGLKDAKVLNVIRNIRYVKETNSLLLTGDPKAIEETKVLIAQYDYPRTMTEKGSSNFYMYKPQHVSAAQIQKSLRDIADSLKKASLIDPNLITAIEGARYVETTNAIIFTGSPNTLDKIQILLKDIDVPTEHHAPIQHIGKTTFLLYKLKHASGPQIVSSLQSMLANLKHSNTSDKEFLNALATMKYVKETNSLLFTGDEESLKKVETLVEQFDVSSLAAPATPVKVAAVGSTQYFLYKPHALTGPQLEQNLQDFAQNLKMSGHNDPELYSTIESSRWIEKVQNLMFTGTPKAIEQVKELLKTFDTQANLPPSDHPSLEPSIQAIDNTNFLVYKLQFHKGEEIQSALRQIAKDWTDSNASVNQNLLSSITSIQWLEVTNSLLCSGDQETLTRLRELIKSLDIPLKQVFIEVLVIETTLSNALSFGLEWGANFNFRNQYAGSTFNTSPATSSTTAPSGFDTNLAALAPPKTPTPQLIGVPAGGFDLGVIGEVIKHNGSTYLTLGSLVSALQSDGETTIVMTPKIITQDGRTSSLFQGSNTPFTGSFVTNSQAGATVQTTNVEYRDIGMQLTVTPVLGNSDIITLDISIDQSQLTGSSAGSIIIAGTNVNTGLTTSKTTMQTTVHVPDKHFLILSGMTNNTNVKTKSGIPCLGGLPLIGAAFSQSQDTITNNSIVIFMKPQVLLSADDMQTLSAQQEEFYRDQTGTPFLQHNFDEAMDYIKSIDDD